MFLWSRKSFYEKNEFKYNIDWIIVELVCYFDKYYYNGLMVMVNGFGLNDVNEFLNLVRFIYLFICFYDFFYYG